jgi:hypothetical protein
VPPPTTVSYDFVQSLVDALNARGLHYAPVAVTNDFTVEGPGLFPTGLMNVQLTDRDAILARTDVPLTISHVQTGNFTHNTVLQTFQGPITLTEGWASVDATLGHHTVRFVTTHFADSSIAVGAAQATELVQGPLSTDLPVMMTCDCDTTVQNALLNPTSALATRIDYIFSRGGGLKATGDQIVGADPGGRSTPGGFWPSDHAGLIAELAQGPGR